MITVVERDQKSFLDSEKKYFVVNILYYFILKKLYCEYEESGKSQFLSFPKIDWKK